MIAEHYLSENTNYHHNNFDLIRLFAASQVLIYHAVSHVGLKLPFHAASAAFLNTFPGVPVFFVISGFLITQSYLRSKSLYSYSKNRFLRLFPALWLCFFVSVALIILTGYFSYNIPSVGNFAVWAASQLSFLQFYNPAFLREWGVGVVNGSLWTIPVEMQFYVIAPVFILIFMRFRRIFYILFLLFTAMNAAFVLSENEGFISDIAVKLASVTFFPWFYMFLIGATVSLHWEKLRHLFEGRFLWWFGTYIIVAIADVQWNIGAHGNRISFPFVLVLAGLVLSGAFTAPWLSDRILSRNDISYGLYIYHMPFFNFIIMALPKRSAYSIWLTIGIIVLFAFMSWRIVEKPALSLKGSTLFKRRAHARAGCPESPLEKAEG